MRKLLVEAQQALTYPPMWCAAFFQIEGLVRLAKADALHVFLWKCYSYVDQANQRHYKDSLWH